MGGEGGLSQRAHGVGALCSFAPVLCPGLSYALTFPVDSRQTLSLELVATFLVACCWDVTVARGLQKGKGEGSFRLYVFAPWRAVGSSQGGELG